jgi:hypothetical protein
MAVSFIVVGFIVLIVLVIRFIQPELIYSVRQALVEVRTNKAFLDWQEGRSSAAAAFSRQLIKDVRYETREYDEEHVLWRVNKIRELYRLLDPRRKSVGSHTASRDRVCIVELAEMLKNIGMHVTPRVEYAGAVVGADGLLTFLANSVRESENFPVLENDAEIQSWFSEHPISIEQTVEILIAAVSALAYRQSAMGRNNGSNSDTVNGDWTAIIKLEKRIRWLVRRKYADAYNDAHAAHIRMHELLGDEEYQDCVRRMQSSRPPSGSIAIEFSDFLDMKQLTTLILAEWPLFSEVFSDKDWLKSRVDYLLPIRSSIAQRQAVNHEIGPQAVHYCRDLEKKIDEYIAKRLSM